MAVLPEVYVLVCDCVCSVQPDSRRHSAENTSPPEGLKRSERLRDRRVHYADMIHGIHPRHAVDAEPKPDDTGHHHHHTASKASLPHRELSGRVGGRTSSTDSLAKSRVAPVEAQQQGTVAVNHRRQSMELRSTERQMSGVVPKPEAPRPLAIVPPSGCRDRQGEIQHGAVESSVGRAAECPATRPATLRCRRHRGSTRRRRMAIPRHSNLLPPSSAPANPSSNPLLNPSNSPAAVAVDCTQQKVATVDSHLADETKVISPVKSVKFIDSGDADVASSVNNNVVKSLDSVDVAVKKTCASAVPCRGGADAARLKRELPLSNVVPVMHVDFSGRVGRRRRTQEGEVLLDRYVSAGAACVRCCSCSEMLPVVEFVRHVHHTYRGGVASERRLGPCGVATPEWHEFQRRRAEFALGPGYCSTPLRADEISTVQTVASQGIPADDKESSVPAADEVMESTDVETLPAVTAGTGVNKKPTSTPADGEDTKSAVVETNPPPPSVPAVNEVTASSSDGSFSAVVGSSWPSEAAVITASSPAIIGEVAARVTRSRSTSDSPVKPSSTADSTPRHSSRSSKWAPPAATTPVRHNVYSTSSRLELRRRPPPRATAQK